MEDIDLSICHSLYKCIEHLEANESTPVDHSNMRNNKIRLLRRWLRSSDPADRWPIDEGRFANMRASVMLEIE